MRYTNVHDVWLLCNLVIKFLFGYNTVFNVCPVALICSYCQWSHEHMGKYASNVTDVSPTYGRPRQLIMPHVVDILAVLDVPFVKIFTLLMVETYLGL